MRWCGPRVRWCGRRAGRRHAPPRKRSGAGDCGRCCHRRPAQALPEQEVSFAIFGPRCAGRANGLRRVRLRRRLVRTIPAVLPVIAGAFRQSSRAHFPCHCERSEAIPAGCTRSGNCPGAAAPRNDRLTPREWCTRRLPDHRRQHRRLDTSLTLVGFGKTKGPHGFDRGRRCFGPPQRRLLSQYRQIIGTSDHDPKDKRELRIMTITVRLSDYCHATVKAPDSAHAVRRRAHVSRAVAVTPPLLSWRRY